MFYEKGVVRIGGWTFGYGTLAPMLSMTGYRLAGFSFLRFRASAFWLYGLGSRAFEFRGKVGLG